MDGRNIAKLENTGKEVCFDVCGDHKDSYNGEQWKCIGRGITIREGGKDQPRIPLRERKFLFKRVV
jgi:hypothetical protein